MNDPVLSAISIPIPDSYDPVLCGVKIIHDISFDTDEGVGNLKETYTNTI